MLRSASVVATTAETKMKAIQGMLSGWAPFDPAALRRNAVILRDICHHSESLFDGSHVERDSRAQATVWEKPEAFDREFRKLHEAVATLIVTVTDGDRTDIAIATTSERPVMAAMRLSGSLSKPQ